MPIDVSAIDETIIPILAPKDDESAFVCRKQFHALNVQAVCDANRLGISHFYKLVIFPIKSFPPNSSSLNKKSFLFLLRSDIYS